MNCSEKLKQINEAIERVSFAKRNTEYYAKLLRDLEDGEVAGVEITCKGRLFTMSHIESVPVFNRVLDIVKIGLELSKCEYATSEEDLIKLWNRQRGN